MPAFSITMLNIGRMAPGSHDYYLSVVAAGAEDYYLARGEAPGRWLGRGLEAVGLDGRVEAEQLRRVLAGDHPATGERLAKHPARKNPGFDLTFRAPKSVSLVWAFGDPEVAAQVVAAHDAAVAAAIGYVEREAARTRRGAQGRERVDVDGVIAAGFRHRTSRAGDPLLHTHVLVANLVRTCDDGGWRTLESRRLFLHAKTAGVLYQAQLRHELTVRLGVAWEPVVNGLADIAGIDRELIDDFSQRRQAILERLEERGESSAKAAQVATLETRAAKEGRATEAELRTAWASRATALGHDPAHIGRVLGRHQPARVDLDRLVADLVDDEALTEKAATFTRRDLLQAVAGRLPDGAEVAELERVADAVVAAGRRELVTLGPRRGQLAAVDTIRRADGRIVAADEDEPRMTTRRLLAAEQHAIDTALARRDDRVAVVDTPTVDRVLAARPTMTAEQAGMVRRLTLGGDGVTVVVGRAGTGKTFSLDAARDAWQTAGVDVHGVALAARAARELQDTAGIASTTIHQLLHQVDRGPGSPLRPGSVLVVDEAGMVGTRQLARLLHHAATQQVKVVLVGDPRQLPEIDAGGLFADLTRRLDPIELTDNRRQTEPWEIGALDQLRHGGAATALAAYDQHGRVVTADTADALREQLVSDWWHAHHEVGATEAVMIALRQGDVDDLNHRARTRLHADGLLTGDPLHVDDKTFQVGDRILCLKNRRGLGVVNGTFATITGIDGHDLEVTDDHGNELRLPAGYVDAGHVTHGYAITGHKAQGLTVDRAFVYGSDELYREWGYVALSRGRDSNTLYVHAAAPDPHGTAHGRQPEPDPHHQTIAGLRRSAAHTPAVAYVDPDEAIRVAGARTLLARRLTRTLDRRAELTARSQQLTDRITAAETDIRRLEGRRDELTGIGRVRRSVRDEIASIDTALAGRRRGLDEDRRRLDDTRRELGSQPPAGELTAWRHQLHDYDRQLTAIADARVRSALHHPPDYVLRTVGHAPEPGTERDRWRDAVRQLERYRTRYGITDPDRPLGDPASNVEQAEHRRQAAEALLEIAPHAVDLDRPAVRDRSLHRGLSR